MTKTTDFEDLDLAQQIAMTVISESKPEATDEDVSLPDGAVALGVLPVHLQRLVMLAESLSLQFASVECETMRANLQFAIDTIERVVNISTHENLTVPVGNFTRMMLDNNWIVHAIPGPSRDATPMN